MTGNINKLFACVILIIGFTIEGIAQEVPKNSTLLTGITLEAENRQELPFVNIRIKNTFYGTASDANGYFSIFISPGDTLLFTYVGYEDATFIMPHKLASSQYSLIQLLVKDTLMLEEVVVFQWPDYKNFVKAFLDNKPPKDTKSLIEEVQRDLDATVDSVTLNKYHYDQMRYQRLFIMHDIFPPNHFLDPSRWADFIRDINRRKNRRR